MIRAALHALIAVASTVVFVVALVPITISVALAVMAYRICREPAYSNCWAWAAARAWGQLRAWVAQGAVKGWEPRMLLRWSRSSPRWFPHVLVGVPLDRGSDELLLESFKPAAPEDAPLWLAWTHVLFLGRVQSGDGYQSVPPT